MNMRSLGPVVAALASAWLLQSCSRVQGPPVTQTRNVEPFQSVELRGGATLDVLVGETQSLVVEGDPQQLDELRTSVRAGRLVVDTQSRFFWLRNGEVKIRITVPELRSLAINGAVKGTITGYAGGSASLVLSGAGDVEASGRVDDLSAVVNGAGNLQLEHLAATTARVIVNGTGNVEVDVSDKLDASLNGVGNIEYHGKPKVLNTAIHGVGSISPK